MRNIEFEPLWSHWRTAARELLLEGVPPDQVWWQPNGDTTDTRQLRQIGFDLGGDEITAKRLPVAKPRTTATFVSLAERAACHRRPDRWAALYNVLWRMNHGEARLLSLASDPAVKLILEMAKAINRDIHKMKAFVRFKTVPEASFDEPRYVAWFEPEHYILTLATPFFVKRFANMRWSILTPDGCVHWEGRQATVAESLWFSVGVDKSAAPVEDVFDEAWKIYYRNIFNPARLKIQAMQSEMPQKYWKNLPEAAVIGELIKSAQQVTGHMLETEANPVELQCGPRPVNPADR